VFAASIQRYTMEAARQLEDRGAYARAVLGAQAERSDTRRPYRGTLAPPAPAASAGGSR
jgi:hypothetical protein